MTAAEARALTNAANQKEFDHETQMAGIMAAIDIAARKGDNVIVFESISLVNINALMALGFKISLTTTRMGGSVKW